MQTTTSTPEVPCPFCAKPGTLPRGRTSGEDGTVYPLRICEACGTVFLWPFPSAEQLRAAYATGYYGEGATKFGRWIERLRDAFATLRARQLRRPLAERACIQIGRAHV